MKRIPIAGKGGIGDHCKATVNELIRETRIEILETGYLGIRVYDATSWKLYVHPTLRDKN